MNLHSSAVLVGLDEHNVILFILGCIEHGSFRGFYFRPSAQCRVAVAGPGKAENRVFSLESFKQALSTKVLRPCTFTFRPW